MKAAERPPPGYTKVHLEVFNKRIDLFPVFSRFDKQQTGVISQQNFLNAMRACGLPLSDKESYDILRLAETDARGDIYYRQLLRRMERTQPDISDSDAQILSAAPDLSARRKKLQGDVARCVLTFYKANSYTGFNRFLLNGVFTESSFLEFVTQNTLLDAPSVRDLWVVMPTMLSPQVLIKWASSVAAQQGVKTIEELKPAAGPPPPPAVVSRLRNLVQQEGEEYVKIALSTFTYMRLQDLQETLAHLEACASVAEFEEFRLWCVNEGVVHLVNSELAFEGGRFSHFIEGYSGEGRPVPGDKPQVESVVDLALRDILSAQMAALKRVLSGETGSDLVTEKHLRKTLRITTPSLTHQNVSLLLSCMALVDPPVRGRPFRVYSASEFVALLSDWQRVQIGAIPPFPEVKVAPPAKENVAPPAPTPLQQVEVEQGGVGKPALLGRRDADWEEQLLLKLRASFTAAAGSFTVKPLLDIFQRIDTDARKVLHLDKFHWTLRTSLRFLSDSEIYHLVQIALEVASSVDERKTAETRVRLTEYLETSETISRVLYPDGSQYYISYTFFLMHLEAKIRLLGGDVGQK